jgi:hypothetical protein
MLLTIGLEPIILCGASFEPAVFTISPSEQKATAYLLETGAIRQYYLRYSGVRAV